MFYVLCLILLSALLSSLDQHYNVHQFQCTERNKASLVHALEVQSWHGIHLPDKNDWYLRGGVDCVGLEELQRKSHQHVTLGLLKLFHSLALLFFPLKI